jgi:hypothetical protein
MDSDPDVMALLETARAALVGYATNDWVRLAPSLVKEVASMVAALPPGRTFGEAHYEQPPSSLAVSSVVLPSPVTEPPPTSSSVGPLLSREPSAEVVPVGRPPAVAPILAHAASAGDPVGSSGTGGRRVLPLPSRTSARLSERPVARSAPVTPLGPPALLPSTQPAPAALSVSSTEPNERVLERADVFRVSRFFCGLVRLIEHLAGSQCERCSQRRVKCVIPEDAVHGVLSCVACLKSKDLCVRKEKPKPKPSESSFMAHPLVLTPGRA